MAPKSDKGKKKPPQVDLAKAAGNKPPPKPRKPPPPPACFSTEDIMRFKELFKMYDEDGTEKIPINLIPVMLRKLGFNPKGSEIEDLCKRFLEDEFSDTFEFPDFLFMIEAKMIMGDDFEAVVTKAMQYLVHDDEETGFANIEVLKTELQQWGEPLSDAEFADWPKVALKEKVLEFETGILNYVKFVDVMNAKDQKFMPEPVNFFKLDQKTLAEMAIKKAMEEKAEIERKEQERHAREEARRQKMIADGLIIE